MIPWQRIESAPLPTGPTQRGGKPAELTLWRRGGDELAIRVGHTELMSSRQHHSEDELGRLACAHLSRSHEAKILVGGLGMGFTLRAVLNAVGPKSTVEVAELVPGVVAWNRGILGPLANHPLEDKRVRLYEGDVAARVTPGANFDAILLDVDNGPTALTAADNSRLYAHGGLRYLRDALRPGGVLAVWSASDDPRFSKRFKAAGFDVLRHHVRARGEAGAIHVLSIGTKVMAGGVARPEAALPMRRREQGDPRDARGFGDGGFPGGGFPIGGGRGRPRRERGAVAGRYGGGSARPSSGAAGGRPSGGAAGGRASGGAAGARPSGGAAGGRPSGGAAGGRPSGNAGRPAGSSGGARPASGGARPSGNRPASSAKPDGHRGR